MKGTSGHNRVITGFGRSFIVVTSLESQQVITKNNLGKSGIRMNRIMRKPGSESFVRI
ncbi:MAG: hypothetical protein QXE05_08405 [Nitrososphaeria archaeon]